jgi:hypothetical protein
VKFDKTGQNVHTLNTLYVAQGGDWVLWDESDYSKGKKKLPPVRGKK